MAWEIELNLGWRGPDARIPARRARLAQATDNLIANAIEHGGSPVQVLGRVEDDTVRIEVVDGGPGLQSPLAELLGEQRRRPRAWSPIRRGHLWGGARRGHGLAIARDVAAEHGGRLAAAPSRDGARLVLELPLTGPAAGTAAGIGPAHR